MTELAVTPTPDRYCPMADRADLPFDVMRGLENYGQAAACARVVRRCLCSSVAHAGIICSPDRCVPELKAAIDWSIKTGNMAAALGGSSKKIWRNYANADSDAAVARGRALDRLIAEILDENEDDE